jgi:hypothetical protein
VDAIFPGYDGADTDAATVINHNRGLTGGIVGGDIEPDLLEQVYRITKADPGRALAAHVTCEMKRYTTAY